MRRAVARFWAWVCTCLRRLLSLLLLVGPTPRHVAFIMDGNRRFASSKHMDKIGGHMQGYSKMVDVIHWCLEAGVQCMSVYAFSIDNFKRSPEEVASLMQLAEEKYKELAQEHGLAEREGVEMRVIGDLSLAPSSVQGAAARMMQATSQLHHRRGVLNICFSYIATEELVQAVDALQQAVHAGHLRDDDLSAPLLSACLHTRDCPPVDLLIRTSGETRLSDFMLWQSSGAQLQFIDCMWPEFGFLHWARCVLRYQRGVALQRRLNKACRLAQGHRGPDAGSAGQQGLRINAASPLSLSPLLALLRWLCSACSRLLGCAAQPGPSHATSSDSSGIASKVQSQSQAVGLGDLDSEGREAAFLLARDRVHSDWIEQHVCCT